MKLSSTILQLNEARFLSKMLPSGRNDGIAIPLASLVGVTGPIPGLGMRNEHLLVKFSCRKKGCSLLI